MAYCILKNVAFFDYLKRLIEFLYVESTFERIGVLTGRLSKVIMGSDWKICFGLDECDIAVSGRLYNMAVSDLRVFQIPKSSLLPRFLLYAFQSAFVSLQRVFSLAEILRTSVSSSNRSLKNKTVVLFVEDLNKKKINLLVIRFLSKFNISILLILYRQIFLRKPCFWKFMQICIFFFF